MLFELNITFLHSNPNSLNIIKFSLFAVPNLCYSGNNFFEAIEPPEHCAHAKHCLFERLRRHR